MRDGAPARGCGICGPRDDRRAFLKQAAFLVAGAVAGLGGSAVAAAGLPLAFGQPMDRSGSDLTYPVPAADGATIDRDNGVIVVRYQGRVCACNLSCPHENAAVRWKPALGRFECSRHDSQYTPDGVYTSGRATRNMDRFPVRRSGDTLVVDVSRLIQSDTQKPQWEAAAIAL